MSKPHNITWHDSSITKEDRRKQNNHSSFVLWFTGLSGSGKSTIANALSKELYERSIRNYVLDGDNIRNGLNRDLSFSDNDRTENIRRISEVSKLFVDNGTVVLTAFISPFLQDRQKAKEIVSEEEFFEIFVSCPIEECEKRDPKGLYSKARKGEIPDFTGIDSPYEEPVSPDITIHTDEQSVMESVETIINHLKNRKLI
ncbi:adenylyl-sulfate kinase [Fictibacillus barbaricus]|uniref:Adenylyl-sulfate kinase n=1 Tax=Fictibacillus barbaricus TaxID=182136 RepID=A0ABS2ZIG2_9BACL|nr:adenylyl-sulfate kinase [Fictibacillus barbaricus]MBN3547930.1 adenylyl-sulfate kinase [Fictibacillus barbaricus]GGB52663.1 adenylyl-sulfate kinase [Fictibacillus barbaricus]